MRHRSLLLRPCPSPTTRKECLFRWILPNHLRYPLQPLISHLLRERYPLRVPVLASDPQFRRAA